MSKKDFIALANTIRENSCGVPFNADQLDLLADFCKGQNPRFNRERWLGYIHGECGPNGGEVKKGGN